MKILMAVMAALVLVGCDSGAEKEYQSMVDRDQKRADRIAAAQRYVAERQEYRKGQFERTLKAQKICADRDMVYIGLVPGVDDMKPRATCMLENQPVEQFEVAE